jgi:hypothetical protein
MDLSRETLTDATNREIDPCAFAIFIGPTKYNPTCAYDSPEASVRASESAQLSAWRDQDLSAYYQQQRRFPRR